MSLTFDTSNYETTERQDFWVSTICSQILPVEIDPRHDVPLRAALRSAQIGSVGFRSVVGGNHVYERTSRHVRREDPQTLQVGMPSGGRSVLIQDGREALLGPRDIVLYDSSRPFTLAMEERFHWRVFLLPKLKLRRSENELREITAVRIDGEEQIAAVVSTFLTMLARPGIEQHDEPTLSALGENAADLVGTVVQSRFGLPWAVQDGTGVLQARAMAFLDEHHGDPHLTPTLVAAALNVSVRRLHQVFEGTDRSLMERLRDIRLAAVRRALSDPRQAHWAISRVAAAHGMTNPAAFSRAFRAEYGLTPREFRRSVLVV